MNASYNKPQVIMLAAGQSSRFGSHKLMHKMPDGRPLILHSLIPYLENDLPVCVICKSEDEVLVQLLKNNKIRVLIAPDAHEGMGNSLSFGVKQLVSEGGWLIALADMPYLLSSSVKKLLPNYQDTIVRPTVDEGAGHPVYFPHVYQAQLAQLSGDEGARNILKTAQVKYLSLEDSGCLVDVDRPQDLRTQKH